MLEPDLEWVNLANLMSGIPEDRVTSHLDAHCSNCKSTTESIIGCFGYRVIWIGLMAVKMPRQVVNVIPIAGLENQFQSGSW